jgi:Nucleoside-diphosphate-sugar epimerases
MSTYLVTGAAGFIGAKVCEFLLAEGHTVVGIDNLNDYYDVRLKDYRLAGLLGQRPGNAETLKTEKLTSESWRPGVDPKVSIYAGRGRLEGKMLKAETLKTDGARECEDGRTAGAARSGAEGEEQREPRSGVATSKTGELSALDSSLSTTHGRFVFEALDIENLAGLEALFVEFKFDAVFNLAARAGVRYSMEHPHVYMSTNAQGTLNLLECQRKHGVKKHVLASTSSLYAGCPMPFTEDQPVNTPLSPYAATKKAAEAMAYSYHHLYGIDVSVVRYFTVYGPAGRPDMAPYRFVHWIATGKPIKLFGDGNQTRDFTYVDDIARGTILAARVGNAETLKTEMLKANLNPDAETLKTEKLKSESAVHSSYNVINIGGGNRPITINAMIELIERELNEQSAVAAGSSQVSGVGPQLSALNPQLSSFRAAIDRQPANPVDMTDTSADISKARRLLGWSPEVSPEEGFKRTVAWYLQNRDWLGAVEVEPKR